MGGVALDTGMDLRRAARHRASLTVQLEHSRLGDMSAHIANLSAHGFMIDDHDGRLVRGDRVQLRLPVVGRIEAYMVWTIQERAGFQFERIIRLPDFLALLEQSSPRRAR